jgi:sulfatase maturation enzyme AslB (radical SAM superfamily)
MHVATSPGGSFRVCCNSDSKNNQLKLNGEQLKLHKHSHTVLHQSETLKEIRQQMLNGERPATCVRCFTQEDAGVRSSRQIYNDVWDNGAACNLDDPIQPRYLDLRLGNLCNIKCRMCNPYSSNQWVEDWEKMNGPFSESERKWLKNMEWPNFSGTDKHLREMMETVEEIYFTGGEPTIIKRHEALLDYCIEQGLAHKIALKYNTNLTNTPVRLIEKWSKFKFLRLNCSIDGVNALNDYIRFPSLWRGIWKNYNQVLKLTTNRVLDIHTTVQVTNVLHLHLLLDHFIRPSANQNNSDIPVIFFNLLIEPAYLNIKVLPKPLKQIVQNRLEPWLGHPDLESLPGVLDYMWHEDKSDLWPEFVKHTQQLDEIRGQRLTDVVPEFNGWI